MPEPAFDPYHKWLSIPKHLQPPTLYQLLSVAPGEADSEVIEENATRIINYVKTYRTGPRAEDCERILRELQKARKVLLNPAMKKAYDAQLAAPRALAVAPVSVELAFDDVNEEELPRKTPRDRPRPRQRGFAGMLAAFAVVVLLGGAGVVAVLMSGSASVKKAVKDTQVVAQAAPVAPKKKTVSQPTPPPEPARPLEIPAKVTPPKAVAETPKVVALPPQVIDLDAVKPIAFDARSTLPWDEISAENAATWKEKLQALNVVYLSDLAEFDVVNPVSGDGWKFGKAGSLGNPRREKIQVLGKPALKGLSIHPSVKSASQVSYNLPKNAQYFRTAVAINETADLAKKPVEVRFEILGDGKTLAATSTVRPHEVDRCIIDVKGVSVLQLRAIVVGKTHDRCHAVWLDPCVYVLD